MVHLISMFQWKRFVTGCEIDMFVNGLENLILHVMFHEESMHMRQPVIENNAQTLNSERESPFQA